jgi:hypothetical protein
MANPPIHKIRMSGVEIAIWQGDDRRSVTIKRTYKPKDSTEWKETAFHDIRDVPTTVACLQAAFQWSIEHPIERTHDDGPPA